MNDPLQEAIESGRVGGRSVVGSIVFEFNGETFKVNVCTSEEVIETTLSRWNEEHKDYDPVFRDGWVSFVYHKDGQ